jgi:uncharacterized membrane protein
MQNKASYKDTLTHKLNHLKSVYRLASGLCLGLISYICMSGIHAEVLTKVMASWDVFCIWILTINGILFTTMKPHQIRLHSRAQDASRGIVSLIVVIASFSSLVGVMFLLHNKRHWLLDPHLEAFIYLFGVVCSWLVMHMVFTLRYAHEYYGDHPNDPTQPAGGLQIPGDSNPSYMDFAYFSYVIGMTFQVSDISITSAKIRKLALVHGMLSFGFNTVILALTINEVVNL